MAGRKPSAQPATTPRFWRDAALPFVEARSVDDGRLVCYGRHAHETFSIGAITQGHCDYLNGRLVERASAGSVVMMNPGDVHACNPIGGSPWSYHMLYVDTAWLAELQRDLGFSPNRDFRPFSTTLTQDASLHAELLRLHATLTSPQAEPLHKSSAAFAFFSGLQQQLDPAPASSTASAPRLARAAEFIRTHLSQAPTLDEIGAAAGLSATHLVRSFKRQFGMTPHAYLVNCRVQYGRAQLRKGRPIAEVAVEAGFADQAHFQRAFRRSMAVTPGQYRSSWAEPGREAQARVTPSSERHSPPE